MKKWLKILLIVLGSLILFLAILSVCIGPIAKVVIEKHSKELCHRVVTMDKLRVNLFTGSVGIYGFRALEEDDETQFMKFNSLKVNINVLPLMFKKVKLRYIKLDEPVINVTQDGTVFNFSDIIEFYKRDEPDTTPSAWQIDLRRISLTRGNICYADLQINSSLCMKDINLEIPKLFFGSGNSDASMRLIFEDGGGLDVKMAYGMDKSDFLIYMNMQDFNLHPLEPYIRNVVNFKKVDGQLSANLSVKGNMNHILDLNAKGNVTLRDFDLSVDDFDHVITIDRLSVDLEDLNLEKKKYYVEKIEIDAFKLNYEINNQGSSLSSFFPSDTLLEEQNQNLSKKEKRRQAKAAKKPVKQNVMEIEMTDDGKVADVRLNHFVLNNCEVDFLDKTLKEGEMYVPVSNITMDAHNLSSNSMSKASIYAHFGKTGEFICRWEGYLSAQKSHTLDLEIKDLQMNELSPYSLHYFAYPITKGVFVFKSHTSLKNQMLDSKNHVDIYNLVVEKKRKDITPEYKLPLQAAVYVLTDMSGRTQMDLPVQGNINSPQFSFKKIIVKAFFNTILRVIASPVDMIIQACRANADAFKPMTLDLDQQSFNSRQYDQLNAINEVMKDKPELVVTMTPSFNIANYNVRGDESQNQLTMQSYIKMQDMIHAHFGQYGITKERLQFSDQVSKKTCPKDKLLLSFDIVTPGMDDVEGMEAAEEAAKEMSMPAEE